MSGQMHKAKINDKRAISEIVSYVILIAIALSTASGIYVWLKYMTPSEKELCSEDVSIIIRNYNCINPNILEITVQNKGLFKINGFFIRAADKSGGIPITGLKSTDAEYSLADGRYEFVYPLIPENYTSLKFDYSSLGSLAKIEVQPYIVAENSELRLCPNIYSQDIAASKNCN